MNWLDLLRFGDPSASPPMETVLLSLLVAFVLGQIIGWVYMATHTTPSYSSSFVASLVVLPVIVSLMMILMAGSLMIAFGLLAVFAVVRFRNVLKDTRDTTYVLWAIVEGMAVGTFRYSTALVGAGLRRAGAVVLVVDGVWRAASFRRGPFGVGADRIWPARARRSSRFCTAFPIARFSRASELTDDARSILSYRLLLRDPARRGELRAELAAAGDVQELSFYLQEDESEL